MFGFGPVGRSELEQGAIRYHLDLRAWEKHGAESFNPSSDAPATSAGARGRLERIIGRRRTHQATGRCQSSGAPKGQRRTTTVPVVLLATVFAVSVWASNTVEPQQHAAFASMLEKLTSLIFTDELDCLEQCEALQGDAYEACVERCGMDTLAPLFTLWEVADTPHTGIHASEVETILVELTTEWIESADGLHVAADQDGLLLVDTIARSFRVYVAEGRAVEDDAGWSEFYAVAVAESLVNVIQREEKSALREQIFRDILRLAENGTLRRTSGVARVGLFSIAARFAATPQEIERLNAAISAHPSLERGVDRLLRALNPSNLDLTEVPNGRRGVR